MPTAFARILHQVKERGALQAKDIANIVNVPPASVGRWADGQGAPVLEHQLMLGILHFVVERLSDFYGPEEIRQWLFAQHPLLNGKTAIDRIKAGSIEPVLSAIEWLDVDAYV